jgi:hypothetical protein
VNSRLPLFVLLVEYALDNPFADWKAQMKVVTTFSRIMSGHCGVRAHLKRFKNVEVGMCVCLEDHETIDHVVLKCLRFSSTTCFIISSASLRSKL